jgi:hypothetical protein
MVEENQEIPEFDTETIKKYIEDSVMEAVIESKPLPANEIAETRNALERALKEYKTGLKAVIRACSGILRGQAIFHASYSAEKVSQESTIYVLKDWYTQYDFVGRDISHAAESHNRHGEEKTRIALDLGYRGMDIPHAAGSLDFWSNPKDGERAMKEMGKLLKKVYADIHEGDIRYAAMTVKNLGVDALETALRDRHKKNDREPWLRGPSIPLIAHAYRLSAPHAGQAIEVCRKNGSRRERIGAEVLASLGRKFNRTIEPPNWMQ